MMVNGMIRMVLMVVTLSFIVIMRMVMIIVINGGVFVQCTGLLLLFCWR